jgi:hypothetical protein
MKSSALSVREEKLIWREDSGIKVLKFRICSAKKHFASL